MTDERIRPRDVARMTSLSVRKVQELAAAGAIPSAAKLGGVWTFDPDKVRAWIRQAERKACHETKATSTFAARLGAVPASPAANIAARYEHLFGVKRRRRADKK